jgi:biotin transporter BioY
MLSGSDWGIQHMKDLGNTIYAFGYVVAATVLGIGVADYWFGHHQLTAFLSWAVLATIPWLVGFAFLYVSRRLTKKVKTRRYRMTDKGHAAEIWEG